MRQPTGSLSPDLIPEVVKSNPENHHLAIHLGRDQLMVGIFSLPQRQPIWIDHFALPHWDMGLELEKSILTTLSFRKVTITSPSASWTLSPPHLFKEGTEDQWLLPQQGAVFSTPLLRHPDAICIEQHLQVYDGVGALFNQARSIPVVTWWLEYHISHGPSTPFAAVFWEDKNLIIAWIENHELKFANQFSASQPEDALYFVSAVMQQMKASEEALMITMGSGMNQESMELFQQFFSQVKMWNTPLGLNWNEKQPAFFYHPLILHTLCAS
jgi:hypothetical protein